MADDLEGRPANMAARQVLPIEDPPVAGDEPPAPAGSAGTSTASDQTPQALQVPEDPHGPMRTRSGRAIGTDVQAPPTTPVHDAYAFKVKTIDAEEDQLLRRIHPDHPFYPEPGVGRMEGAVPTPFGFVHDLRQLFEILEHGASMAICGVDFAPLSIKAIDQFVQDIIQEMSDLDPLTADAGLAMLHQCITDWAFLYHRIQDAQARHADNIDGDGPHANIDYPFYRDEDSQPRNPFTFHFVFIWLLLNDYVVEGMESALTATAFVTKVDGQTVPLMTLLYAPDLRDRDLPRLRRIVVQMEELHASVQRITQDADTLATLIDDEKIRLESAEEGAADYFELTFLTTQRALLLERQEAISYLWHEPDDPDQSQKVYDAVVDAADATYTLIQHDQLSTGSSSLSASVIVGAVRSPGGQPTPRAAASAVPASRTRMEQADVPPFVGAGYGFDRPDFRSPSGISQRTRDQNDTAHAAIQGTDLHRTTAGTAARSRLGRELHGQGNPPAAQLRQRVEDIRRQYSSAKKVVKPSLQAGAADLLHLNHEQYFDGPHLRPSYVGRAEVRPRHRHYEDVEYRPVVDFSSGLPEVKHYPAFGVVPGGPEDDRLEDDRMEQQYPGSYREMSTRRDARHDRGNLSRESRQDRGNMSGSGLSYTNGACTEMEYDQEIDRVSARMPSHLQEVYRRVDSIKYKVDTKLLDTLLKFDGSHSPVTLRLFCAKVRDVTFLIPKGSDDRSLQSYLMYHALTGRAKEVIDVENQRLRGLGMEEVHRRADNGNALLAHLYTTFPIEETNVFMLNLLRLVRVFWRDANAPQENLREFAQRFNSLRIAAGTHYPSDDMVICRACGMSTAQVMPELTLRMLYMSALPAEIQVYATTQRKYKWDDPLLSAADLQDFHEMIQDEYERRAKRKQPLTRQQKFSAYPSAVLSERTGELLVLDAEPADVAVLEADVVVADGAGRQNTGGRARPKQGPTPSQTAAKALFESLAGMNEAAALDKLITTALKTGSDPLVLVRAMSALKYSGSNNTMSHASLDKLTPKHRALFHGFMATLLGSGSSGGNNRRYGNTRTQTLVKDDSGADLLATQQESVTALFKIPPEQWRTPKALDLQKNHYQTHNGTLQPSCVVCGDLGHIAATCMPHLKFLIAKKVLSSLPPTALTTYNYGVVVDVHVTDAWGTVQEPTEDHVPANLADMGRSGTSRTMGPRPDTRSSNIHCDDFMAIGDLKIKAAEEIRALGLPATAPPPVDFELREQVCDIPELCALLAELDSQVPRQMIILYMGDNAAPVRCLVDTGATTEFMRESVARDIGLRIVKAPQPMRIRTADGTVSPNVISRCVRGTTFSALNGEVTGVFDKIGLMPSMPEWCDAIIGRSGIFNVLRGSIERDALRCYTVHQPNAEYPPVPTDPSQWKLIPFTNTSSIPSIAVAELCNVVLPMGSDGDDMMITDHFSDHYEEVLQDYVMLAQAVPAKHRTKQQRQAIAKLRELRAAQGPSPALGPLPQPDDDDPLGTDLPAPFVQGLIDMADYDSTKPVNALTPLQHKAYSLMLAVAAALLMFVTPAATAAATDLLTLDQPSTVMWQWDDQVVHPSPSDKVPWQPSQWDAVDREATAVGSVWNTAGDAVHVDQVDMWLTDLGFTTAPTPAPVDTTTANADMARVSGAAATHGNSTSKSALPITREKWFPTLRYEAIVKPAGPTNLRARMTRHGYTVSLPQITEALDIIRPDVEVDTSYVPPPEGDVIRTSGRLPDSVIDTPWPHKMAYAEATRNNTDRFTCLNPIEKYEPPAHHKRLKLELHEGRQLPRGRQPRPTPLGIAPQLAAFCRGLKSQGRITLSTSPVASPVLIIPKPKKLPTDEPRYRFVIDYRAINEVIKHHGFRVNTCDSLWYTLDKAKYISTADAADGYWLAPLDKTTAYLTAFDAPDGRYEWTCLPMGIQPASGWFQSFMEDILAANDLLYTGEGNRKQNADTGRWENFVIVYQDDLIATAGRLFNRVRGMCTYVYLNDNALS